MKTNKHTSRRKFIGNSALFSAGLLLPGNSLIGAPAIIRNLRKPDSRINGVQLGVITYSYRSMPDQSAEATLKYILDSGINAIELMGGPAESFAGMPQSGIDRRAFYGLMRKQRNGELSEDELKEFTELQAQRKAYNAEVAKWRLKAPFEKFEKFRKMYNDAGVSIYAFKPSAFGKNNTDAEIDYGFKAAKLLGASHVTLEHPSDDAHTLKLGKMAEKHQIGVAYHGHEQQTPTFWDTALQQSPMNMLNADMGHYTAAGNDLPLELLKKHSKRIASIHIKDRQTPANGKENLIWGKGDTPIAAILNLMSKNKYAFPATIELEYKIPEGSDAIKEVSRCLEYCKAKLNS
ncbi:sugar phosphate isomerase/epimerase family protein [Muriicola sp. Z0-33]|uniref:sugar phosphate isomerase/epimerase family protein n=1 Tax=Muriicola sp. Z0-33 TaxID=2816957 RepID=UPI0022371BD2|nr:sugar phosphate isomerase/epimerase [Muriicola sp. Z0-33]MCW5515751.1 sugar phosphate isomerase/epimerase [Muriicola sp. Z0-33]